MATRRSLVLVSVVGIGCSSWAEARPPRPDVIVVEEPVRSPYTVELLDQTGATIETYAKGGRFYVLGRAGERYTIRVTNPTARRIEAVVSVDGLDVIDGEPADFVRKRGYVVPARGELRIDGFRVSTSHVATFRFSSVRDSYAGRKGKPRNVGVIGVAIFEEAAAPEIVVEDRRAPAPPPDYDYEEEYYFDDVDGADAPAPAAPTGGSKADAPAEPAGEATGGGGGGGYGRGAVRSRSRAPSKKPCCGEAPRRERPGLGTQFGENRHSAVSFTRFERKSATKPDSLAELRYNDAEGLRALGIDVGPAVDPYEIELRETADPFPHTSFARPPQ